MITKEFEVVPVLTKAYCDECGGKGKGCKKCNGKGYFNCKDCAGTGVKQEKK